MAVDDEERATARTTTSGPPAIVAAPEEPVVAVPEDYESLEDIVAVDSVMDEDVLVDYKGHVNTASSGGGNVKYSLGGCQRATARAGTVPSLGEQHASAPHTYGGDAFRNEFEDAEPPDECAKNDVSCGGSPQIKGYGTLLPAQN